MSSICEILNEAITSFENEFKNHYPIEELHESDFYKLLNELTDNIKNMRDTHKIEIAKNISYCMMDKFEQYTDSKLLLFLFRKCNKIIQTNYNLQKIKSQFDNIILIEDERLKIMTFLSSYYNLKSNELNDEIINNFTKILKISIKAIERHNLLS